MIGLYIAICMLLLLVAVWLFLIAAKKDKKMDNFKSVYYAHRGLHGKLPGYEDAFPENSLAAFARAVEKGFGIELDVRQTADGEIVVFHDDTLDRVAGVEGKVRDMTLSELKEFTLLETEEKIPLFTEVLELVAGKVPLLVEIKDDGFGASTVRKTMKILEGYSGEYITESFNPLLLGEVKKCAPSVMRGFLCDKLTAKPQYRALKYRIVQRHLLNFIARPHFIACARESSKMFPIGIIRTLFRPAFIAWTIRSAEEERDARARGFNGVIFEGYIPERARSEADK